MNNKEDKLQYSCILWFSQNHPEMKGQLFAVNNGANSQKQAVHLKSLGVYAGVSDLIFIRPRGTLVAIEMKAPDTKHKSDHVRKQAKWGKLISELGGESYFCTSKDEFIKIIDGDCNVIGCYEVLDFLDEEGKASIKFPFVSK